MAIKITKKKIGKNLEIKIKVLNNI